MTGRRTEQMDHGVTIEVQAVLRLHNGATVDRPKGRHLRETVRVLADRLLLAEDSTEEGDRRGMAAAQAALHLHKGATMGHPKGRRETAVALAGRLLLDEALMEQKGRHAAIVVLAVPHLPSADQTGLMVRTVHLLRTAAPQADPRCAPRVRRISTISKRRSIGFSEIWRHSSERLAVKLNEDRVEATVAVGPVGPVSARKPGHVVDGASCRLGCKRPGDQGDAVRSYVKVSGELPLTGIQSGDDGPYQSCCRSHS